MTNRIALATLGPFGIPNEFLSPDIPDSFIESHSRVKSALNGEFYVFPSSYGLYQVDSVTDGVVENTYTIRKNDRLKHCSCKDFMYMDNSEANCKHLWRVKFMIEQNCIPSEQHDPYSWFINEIRADKEWLKSRDESPRIKSALRELDQIEKTATLGYKEDINYRQVMRRRGQAMIGCSDEF
jgi:hypothetical protein